MYYSATKLLAPSKYNDPEYSIPDDAVLSGVCYDYATQELLLYNHTSKKLMWLQKDVSVITRSVDIGLFNSTDRIIDICAFKDIFWCLVYKGNGKLSIGKGSLHNARTTQEMILVEYPVPYHIYSYGTVSTFNVIHTTPLNYLRFHPLFCSIFNIGKELYLVAGLSDNVDLFNPPNLGQWIFYYDVSGMINKVYKADDSTAVYRPSIIEDKLNGRLVAATTHDGIIAGITLPTVDTTTGTIKILKPQINTYDVSTRSFVTGLFEQGASMCAVGRNLYYATGNKLYVTEIFMFEVYMDENNAFANSVIDIGTLATGTVITRKIFIRNVSPYYVYSNICLATIAPGITLSLTGEAGTFGEDIKIIGPLALNEAAEFYIRVAYPDTVDDQIPMQFYEDITITSAATWGV